jgi:hypothetical protein
MEDKKQYLDAFFDQYAGRFNQALKGEDMPDVKDTMNCFDHYFIESSPLGVVCSKNDDHFKDAIPKGYQFYEDTGITSMNILSKEITLLNDFHAMVKVHWSSAFRRHDHSTGTIEFDVFYFLRMEKSEYKIFAYITGDEQKALKDHGLV